MMLITVGVSALVFVLLLVWGYRTHRNQTDALEQLSASQRVINTAENLLDALLRTEASRADYTGKTTDSLDFQTISRQLDSLGIALVNDPYQMANVNTLVQLVDERQQVQQLKRNPQYIGQVKTAALQLIELERLKRDNYSRQLATGHSSAFILNVVLVSLTFLLGVVSLFTFFSDQLKHAKVESNLTELNLNKDKFFSIISHDLRGPTANIVRLSEFLLEPNLADPDRKTMTTHLHKSAQNLQKLLENLLSWAKFQMGRLDYMPTPVDLHLLVNESISQVNTMATDKAIVIKNQVAPRTYAYADDQMILMVLRNLLVNAIKFTNQAGTVRISTTETPEEVSVSVTDTGIGMNAETVGKLFQLGNHFTTLGTSNEKGSGLGLILCMELLEKNHGSIRVSSEPGKGSTFTFTLPKLGKQHS
jgi:signal transduction histidine kinase